MKRIVICCDGTWNRADQEHNGAPCPSNVVKLACRVAQRDADGNPQIIFYDQGVGSGNSVDRLSGGAFGHGLEDNILDAYRFLIANYEAGDQLYLFGFSRGAFTARSLAGMIKNCGIVRRDVVSRYAQAVRLYRSRRDRPDDTRSVRFRCDFSYSDGVEIPIHFIGVWDTVGSLGIPLRGLRGLTRRKYQFHDVELSGAVRNAYHALSIDEFRGPFEPTLWATKKKEGQEIRQVWFVGAHSDVGGGYSDAQLSDIALEWMLEKAASCDLSLDPAIQNAMPLHPVVTAGPHISKTGFYRVSPDLNRLMGVALDKDGTPTNAPDPTQDLHPTVRNRWDSDRAYRPRPLRQYFQLIGDPRATER